MSFGFVDSNLAETFFYIFSNNFSQVMYEFNEL